MRPRGRLGADLQPSGANLLSGVATALLAPRSHTHPPQAALFEVDEAALSEVARQLPPRVLLLMNLFRDQLDRHGELEQLADRWERLVAELPPSSTPVLNADDPAIAALAGDRAGVLTFGIDDPSVALPGGLPHAADSTRCRACSAPLTYDLVILGHLGHWRCPSCDARRPVPDVRATRVELRGVHGIGIRIETPGGPIQAELALPGVHNAYNATAAVATALAMGVPAASIARGLESSPAAFGRSERVRLDGRELVLLLAKNPTGANETVRTILLDPEPPHLLIALNDRTADGNDVSWIWDVDLRAAARPGRVPHAHGRSRLRPGPARALLGRRGRRAPGPARPRARARRRHRRDARRRHALRPAHLHGDAGAAGDAGPARRRGGVLA